MGYFEHDFLWNSEEFNKTMCLKMKELRTRSGITQEEFAKKVGLQRGHISTLENGRNKINLRLFFQYCDICEVTVDEALGRERPENITSTPFTQPDKSVSENIINAETKQDLDADVDYKDSIQETDNLQSQEMELRKQTLDFYTQILKLPDDERKIMLNILKNDNYISKISIQP